jgi:hypothetical protein
VNEVKTAGNLSRGRGSSHQLYADYSPPTQNLGTGFGKQAEHRVCNTTFVSENDEPNAIAVIYYDDFHGLQKRGIRVNRSAVHNRKVRLPNPFPRDTGCTPPDGWRG